MDTVRTVVCQLNPTAEQAAAIRATLRAFADACNAIADVARAEHTTNKVRIQRACYPAIRQQFGLSANLTIRAIARVCAALKVPVKAHSQFAPTSIDYDARIFRFRARDDVFSLTLLTGRAQVASRLGAYQRRALAGQQPTSATLVQRRNGTFYLHVQVKHDTPEAVPSPETLGVDLGRRRVAVDSDGTVYAADAVNRLRAHYPTVRRSLQAKGTKGARRALKRLSGREQRHMRAVNHVISRRLVDTASTTHRALALEDLTGIRARTTVRKPQRYAQQSWTFAQLRGFLTYKAQDAGVPVRLVNPAYTSQTCHRCGVRGHRDGLTFSCDRCGSCDADHNAAINIASRGGPVTPPVRAGVSASSAKATGL